MEDEVEQYGNVDVGESSADKFVRNLSEHFSAKARHKQCCRVGDSIKNTTKNSFIHSLIHAPW